MKQAKAKKELCSLGLSDGSPFSVCWIEWKMPDKPSAGEEWIPPPLTYNFLQYSYRVHRATCNVNVKYNRKMKWRGKKSKNFAYLRSCFLFLCFRLFSGSMMRWRLAKNFKLQRAANSIHSFSIIRSFESYCTSLNIAVVWGKRIKIRESNILKQKFITLLILLASSID